MVAGREGSNALVGLPHWGLDADDALLLSLDALDTFLGEVVTVALFLQICGQLQPGRLWSSSRIFAWRVRFLYWGCPPVGIHRPRPLDPRQVTWPSQERFSHQPTGARTHPMKG